MKKVEWPYIGFARDTYDKMVAKLGADEAKRLVGVVAGLEVGMGDRITEVFDKDGNAWPCGEGKYDG